jgi:hypothetical protein
MPETLEWSTEQYIPQISLHFDVPDHKLDLVTFRETATAASAITAALGTAFFGNALQIEFFVLPPTEGSFFSRLKLVLGWGGGAFAVIFGFLNSEMGSAFVDGLTGKPSATWARELGMQGHDLLSFTLSKEGGDSKVSAADCEVLGNLLTEMTRGILEKDSTALEALDKAHGYLAAALDARADFYQACLHDPRVRGVGFTPKPEFPIPRSSFPERAIKRKREEAEDDDGPWNVKIAQLSVTSPNWDKSDQKSRNWKGKDSRQRDSDC